MAEHHTCTCDACGHDLTSVCDQPGHERLRLRAESIPWVSDSPVANSLYIPPLLDRDFHFCDLGCLASWAARAAEHGRHEALDKLVAQAQELNMGY